MAQRRYRALPGQAAPARGDDSTAFIAASIAPTNSTPSPGRRASYHSAAPSNSSAASGRSTRRTLIAPRDDAGRPRVRPSNPRRAAPLGSASRRPPPIDDPLRQPTPVPSSDRQGPRRCRSTPPRGGGDPPRRDGAHRWRRCGRSGTRDDYSGGRCGRRRRRFWVRGRGSARVSGVGSPARSWRGVRRTSPTSPRPLSPRPSPLARFRLGPAPATLRPCPHPPPAPSESSSSRTAGRSRCA